MTELPPPTLDPAIAKVLLERLPVGVIVLDNQKRVICWNEWVAEATEVSASNAIGKSILELFPEIENTRLSDALEDALQLGFPALLSFSLHKSPLPLFRKLGNEELRLDQVIQVLSVTLPNYPRACVIQISDVTHVRMREEQIRKQGHELRELQHRQQALLHSIPDIAWLKDVEGRYIAVNARFAAVYGVPVESVAGKTDIEIQIPSLVANNFASDALVLETGVTRRYDETIADINGRVTWVETIKVPIFNQQSELIGLAGVARDITDRKTSEERIHFLAHYDSLTELPNRFMLFERLDHLIAHARRNNKQIAILFIDLDRFKIINDSMGHHAGDALLRQVAERLNESRREVDIIARVGGDEFIVALSDVPNTETIAAVAKKLLLAICRPFHIDGQEIHITPSMGVSVYPKDGEDIVTLVKNADRAMYRVKESGRNSFEFFTPAINAFAIDKLAIETGLRLALLHNEFELQYQSQIDLSNGQIVGAEAQIRWRHPELGLIPPMRFIAIAEESGLIIPIGDWVMATACAQNQAWQDEGFPRIPVAVNLSAVQLREKNFVSRVSECLVRTGLAPNFLDLEITESVIMTDAESTIQMLDQLKTLGVQLSVDDFGTGYSSLSYLKRFPIDRLKIDQSFVRDVTTDANDAAITGAIIAMAKQLQLSVVAEGVETIEQLRFLRGQNCDQIQGYYLSQPLSAEDFAVHLKNGLTGQRFETGAFSDQMLGVATPVADCARY